MRIVAHNGSSILGGGEIGTALLLQGLQARGHEVMMLCRDARMRERLRAYGIPVEVLYIGGEVVLPHALRFAGRLRKHRPDALVLTTFKKVALAGLGARIARVPRVVQRVVLSSDVPRSVTYRFALRNFVDLVALNAEAMREGFLAGDPGLDPARVRTIHDGVRPPERRAPPGAVRRALALPAEAVVIGSVTRLAPQKRLDRMIRSLALLPPHVHCVLAGEGEGGEPLRGLAAELGVADRLHLLGFRSDVGDVLDALDVFVISSDREGMANAMLEAMAVGVPVVSTPVSGAEEALEPLASGSEPGVVTDFSAESLAAALQRLIGDAELRRRMGEAAARSAEERFGFGRFLDEWEAVLSGEGPGARTLE